MLDRPPNGVPLAFLCRTLESVEQIEELEPRIVVAGHKRPDARDDDTATILGETETYIRDFDQTPSKSHSAQKLVDKVMVLHGDLGNPYTLWTAPQRAHDS